MEQMTFVAAVRKFFGPRKPPNDTPAAQLAELKALTTQDREDFIGMFKTVGIEVVSS